MTINTTIRPYTCNVYSRSGCRVAVKQCVVVALVDLLEGFEEGVSRCEHAVGQQESVEEINAQEAQICQAVQQPVHTGMPDLKHTNDQIFTSLTTLIWQICITGRSMFVTTDMCLSWQKYACHDKTSAATKLCLSQQNIFAVTKLLSQQIFVITNTCVCCDKYFFMTKDVFCYDKHIFVTTKVSLSWQNFSQQNYVCCDKTFVAAKMILVTAPTNDRAEHTNVDFTRRATSETYKYRFYHMGHTGTVDLKKKTHADFTRQSILIR